MSENKMVRLKTGGIAYKNKKKINVGCLLFGSKYEVLQVPTIATACCNVKKWTTP